MPSKIIQSVHGDSVSVSHKRKTTRDGLQRIHIKARCGKSTHELKPIFGAIDGPRSTPPTSQQVRDLLERDLLEAANHASWKERTRIAFEDIEDGL